MKNRIASPYDRLGGLIFLSLSFLFVGCRKLKDNPPSTSSSGSQSLSTPHAVTPISDSLITLAEDKLSRFVQGHTATKLPVKHHFLSNKLRALKNKLDQADINQPDPDFKNFTALHWAVCTNDKTIIQALLERGAAINSPDEDQYTPLHRSILWNQLQAAQVLLDQGADIYAKASDGKTPLDLVLDTRPLSVDMVKLLIKKLGKQINHPDENQGNLLHKAVRNNHLALLNILIAADQVDIHLKNKQGATALHLAALGGQQPIVKALLAKKGINIEERDHEGRTALHIAAYRGHQAIVKILIDQGVSINAKDREGKTALHQAALLGKQTVVKTLVKQKGIKVNEKDHSGVTALHLAAYYGFKEIVKILVAAGAHILEKDQELKTPLDRAREKNHTEIIDFLTSKLP